MTGGHRLVSIGLRGATLLVRFTLVLVLARFLSAEEVGLYGLVAATVAYAIYPLGLDFYTYTSRELLKTDRNHWGHLLKNQAALVGLMYVCVAPLLLLIFSTGLLPWELAPLFFVLLVSEHLAGELYRLLVVAEQPTSASVVLFLRLGLSGLVIACAMAAQPATRQLSLVLWIWLAGSAIATLFGLSRIWALGIQGWRLVVDWSWIRRGVAVAVPLLIGTLTIRAFFTVDRYAFQALQSREALGAYVLFVGLASALPALLDAGVFSFSYPRLIAAHTSTDARAFNREASRMWRLTIVVCTIFNVIALASIQPLLARLRDSTYDQYAWLFPWALAGATLYALGLVPHFLLYSVHRDAHIVISHIFGLVVFTSAVLLAAQFSPPLAVPFALTLTFAGIFAWKWVAFSRVAPDDYRIPPA